MTDGMLHDILEVERRIEAELERERTRADAWAGERKAEIDREAERARSEASASACRLEDATCRTARMNGAKRLRDMRKYVQSLRHLSDRRLRELVTANLAGVLGEETDDHPDGQS